MVIDISNRFARFKSKQWSYLIDAAFLALLCFIFFWRDLSPVAANRTSFVGGDFIDQFFAFASYEAARLQSGQLPLWNPYAYAGHPFIADVQSAIFYPLSALTMLLTRHAHPWPLMALEVEAILHLWLAGLFTYLFARRLLQSRLPALVAAIIFTFSGYLTSYPLLQLAIIETIGWLPLILLFLDIAAEAWFANKDAHAWRWMSLAGLTLGISALAGHPQSFLLVITLTIFYTFFKWFFFCPVRSTVRSIGKRLLLMSGYLSIGLGIAAIQLFPTLEYMRLSTRATGTFEEMGNGFTPYELIQTLLPAIGIPVPALYTGILTLGLAALALLVYKNVSQDTGNDSSFHSLPKQTRFWAIVATLGLLLSFGKHLPVYQIFYIFFPGWNLFRQQERTIVWFVLAVALLAGMAVAWLAQQQQDKKSFSLTITPIKNSYRVGILLAALAVLLCFIGYQAGYTQLWGFTAATMFLLAMLVLSLLALMSRRPWVILCVLLLDLWTITPANHSGPLITDPFPTLELLQPLQEDPEPTRVINQQVLPAHYGLIYGIEDIGGASPLQLASVAHALHLVPEERLWMLLNVRYIISHEATLAQPVTQVTQGVDLSGQPAYVHLLSKTMPRAWLSGQIIVANPEETWSKLADPQFDLSTQVLLPAVPSNWQATPSQNTPSGNILWQKRTPEDLALQVTTDAPAILVVSEIYYPGWQASIDEAPTQVLEANGLLRAVVVPAGLHQIHFSYRPTSIKLGALLTLLTLIVTVTMWWILGSRSSHKSPVV